MKKLCALIIMLVLLLSACIDPELGTENTALPDDTSTFPEHNQYLDPTGTITGPLPTGSVGYPASGDYCTVGQYTFQYVSFWHAGEPVNGWTLYYCEDSVETAELPSEVLGIPVIGIGHYTYGNAVPFGENAVLREIVIPDSVVYISYTVFQNCNNLSVIRLSGNIKELGNGTPLSDNRNCLLAGTAVRFLDVPEGVEKICEFVFEGSSLESIILPSTLKIVEYCFDNCPLKEVFYRGTAEQCPQTLLDQVATTDATIYYLSETEPTGEGNFWHYVDGQPVIW